LPSDEPSRPSVIVVMGVSGSGKSTIAAELARALGWPFREGDNLHPAANVEKMRGGTPLTDADRWPWLRRIAEAIDAWRTAGEHGVIACSALKRAYRDLIIGARPDVRLVYLRGDEAMIRARLVQRRGHYMPAALLASQFEALEPPGPDEHAIVVDIDGPPATIVAAILRQLPP
jgi:gluconokinase